MTFLVVLALSICAIGFVAIVSVVMAGVGVGGSIGGEAPPPPPEE